MKNKRNRLKNRSKKPVNSWQSIIVKRLVGLSAVLSVLAAIASIYAVWPQLRQSFENPATVHLVAPRLQGEKIDINKMILLDRRFEQRFFYMVNNELLNKENEILIQFPFTLTNIGDKKLDKVTIIFEFTHISDMLISNPPEFTNKDLGFVVNLPMNTIDITGRNSLKRGTTETSERATVTYNLSELLPQFEATFEFHFIPSIYPVSIKSAGESVDIAAYNVSVKVISESITDHTKFKLFVLPADSPEDFSEGARLFSLFLNHRELSKENYFNRMLHYFSWSAKHFTTEFEDVEICPVVATTSLIGRNIPTLSIENNIKLRRYILTYKQLN